MIYSRDYLNQLASDARRLEREADEHKRRGHFVLAADKRVAADGIREQLQTLQREQGRQRLAVRFG